MHTQTSPLLHLPIEILDAIVAQLRDPYTPSTDFYYTSVLALRWTCRALHAALPSPPPPFTLTTVPSCFPGGDPSYERVIKAPSRDHVLHELLRLECWPAYSVGPEVQPGLQDPTDLPSRRLDVSSRREYGVTDRQYASRIRPQSMHACAVCLRLRPSTAFAAPKVTGHNWKDRAHSADLKAVRATATRRFCIDCGLRKGSYGPGQLIRFWNGWDRGRLEYGSGFVCKRCRRFIVNEESAQSSECLARMCGACKHYRGRR